MSIKYSVETPTKRQLVRWYRLLIDYHKKEISDCEKRLKELKNKKEAKK